MLKITTLTILSENISIERISKITEDINVSQILNNRTLDKIHLNIDNYIVQTVKDEEDEERAEFEAADGYNPYD